MEQIISKQEFDEMMKIQGEARGIALKTEAGFILKEEGEDGLKKIEDIITNLGFPIKYKKIRPMSYYPIGLVPLTFLAIKRLFNYDDKKFHEMGAFEAKSPIAIKLFMRYFVSLKRAIKDVPKMWRIYYTAGQMKVTEFYEEKRYLIVTLENFRLSPIMCQVFIGYFPIILQLVVGGKPTCKEIKCMFRGDDHHEFLLKW